MRTFSALATLISVLVLAACGKPQSQEDVERYRADKIVKSITYVKDPNANLCFAYFEVSGGASTWVNLVAVPCENIPPKMLKTASVK